MGPAAFASRFCRPEPGCATEAAILPQRGNVMKFHLAVAASALAAGLMAGAGAAANDAAAKKFAADRLTAFGKGDVATLVGQYRPDAVVITPMGTLTEPAKVKGMIEGIIAEFGRPGVKFELISQAAVGEVVTFVWKAETHANVYDLGAETYVLKDGKIAYQTFAAKVAPKK
jgi:hypothetical protein